MIFRGNSNIYGMWKGKTVSITLLIKGVTLSASIAEMMIKWADPMLVSVQEICVLSSRLMS